MNHGAPSAGDPPIGSEPANESVQKNKNVRDLCFHVPSSLASHLFVHIFIKRKKYKEPERKAYENPGH